MEKQRIHDCISDIAGGNPRLFPYFFPPGYQLLQLYILVILVPSNCHEQLYLGEGASLAARHIDDFAQSKCCNLQRGGRCVWPRLAARIDLGNCELLGTWEANLLKTRELLGWGCWMMLIKSNAIIWNHLKIDESGWTLTLVQYAAVKGRQRLDFFSHDGLPCERGKPNLFNNSHALKVLEDPQRARYRWYRKNGYGGYAWYGTIHLFCGLLAHDIVHPLIIQQSYGTSPYLIAKSYRINGYKWAISAMMSVGGYCIINPIIYSNYSPLVPFLLVKHG